jgi:hypothetical protein
MRGEPGVGPHTEGNDKMLSFGTTTELKTNHMSAHMSNLDLIGAFFDEEMAKLP